MTTKTNLWKLSTFILKQNNSENTRPRLIENSVRAKSSHHHYPSSCPEVFCKTNVLRNFAKFTGKHLCQSLWHKCFPVNFAKFLRTPFSQNTSGRLRLQILLRYSKQRRYLMICRYHSLSRNFNTIINKKECERNTTSTVNRNDWNKQLGLLFHYYWTNNQINYIFLINKFMLLYLREFECVKVPMPAHQVLPLTVYIFEASYSTSATQAYKI